MVASRHPRPEEMEAYERVLVDALAGDQTLFARQDYVEEAWRIVDPVLKAGVSDLCLSRRALGVPQRLAKLLSSRRLGKSDRQG